MLFFTARCLVKMCQCWRQGCSLNGEYYQQNIISQGKLVYFLSLSLDWSGFWKFLQALFPPRSCAVHCPWEPCGPAAVDKAEWRLLALLVGRPAAAAPAVCIGNAANRATLCCLVWISDWNICEAEWCEKINVSAPTHSVSECECVDRGEEGRWGEINTWKKSQDCSAFQCLRVFMVKGADIYFLGLLCSFFALSCSFFTVEIFTGLVRLDLFPSAFRFGLNWLIKEMANIFKERLFFFFYFSNSILLILIPSAHQFRSFWKGIRKGNYTVWPTRMCGGPM